MPNHVTNQITFGTDSAALSAFHTMLEELRADGEPLGSIDFNKLIPMPPALNIERSSVTERGLRLYQSYMRELDRASPAERSGVSRAWAVQRQNDSEAWALGQQAFENIQKYGCPTWYEWANRHWGTKWTAYRCRPLGTEDDTMAFLTAWSAPLEILSAMSRRYPEQTIHYRWADEDLGRNVGEMTFRSGGVIDSVIPADGSREAYELAAAVLGVELSSFHLYLSSDQSRYEYREPARPTVEKGWEKRRER